MWQKETENLLEEKSTALILTITARIHLNFADI